MTWEDNLWLKMKKMQTRIDKAFSQVWNSSGRYYRKAWADFDENDKEFILHIELPGIEKENIILELNGRILEIRAEKKKDSQKDEKEVKYFSRTYVGFARSISLPEEADLSKIDVVFKNGILTVRILKEKGIKKRIIKIQ